MKVAIHVPNDATAKVNGVIGTRRGAPLGFDGRDGWRGWDTVRAEMPLSEVTDLIVDLRSLTQGVGTFEMEFDHFAELSGQAGRPGGGDPACGVNEKFRGRK